jgi:hypothetical protein
MKVLKSQHNGSTVMRFKIGNKTIAVKARAYSLALKELNKYKEVWVK